MLTKSPFFHSTVSGNTPHHLPDVSHETKSPLESQLEWVGMDSIEVPVNWQGSLYPAKVKAFVNLVQSEAKGIHMSRLYLKLQKNLPEKQLSLKSVKDILEYFVSSQEELSDSAYIKVEWQWPVKRKALASSEEGWRNYPVWVEGELRAGEFVLRVGGTVLYSSTCPCSAALARQLIQRKFLQDHSQRDTLTKEDVAEWLLSEESILATPHAQRSEASFNLRINTEKSLNLDLLKCIDGIEQVLATPVQTVVKRQDEQIFALLNGQNLMFCEDAARRLKILFEENEEISEYWAEVSHKESLHPHNATAQIHKRK